MTNTDTVHRPDGTDPSTSVDQTPVGVDETAAARPNVATAVETVVSHLHPTPSWDVADHPMPTGREEIWRFSPIRQMRGLLTEHDSIAALDWQGDTPARVSISGISADEARGLAAEAPVDRVSALAAAQATHSTRIDVPAEADITEPVLLTAVGRGGEARDRVVITVGNHARVTLVLRYQGSASYAEKTDVIVGDGATLNLVFLQDWDDDAVHGGQRSISVGRDAHVKMVSASIGGKVVRLQENARFAAPGGELEQFGLYLVDGGQHIEHRLFVDHNQPLTKSNVDYRGALQGKGARSVWIGDVLIRKVAEGIETYEANKNLVLTDGCQADSVPNLEIETGDIAGAGHSSTTGRFDDEQLFYLESRGIPEEEARRLVVHGFFVDIIRRIGVPEIEQRMLAEVERELDLVASTDTDADPAGDAR